MKLRDTAKTGRPDRLYGPYPVNLLRVLRGIPCHPASCGFTPIVIHLCINSSIQSSVYPSIYPHTNPSTHQSVDPPILPFIEAQTPSFTRQQISPVHPSIRPPVDMFTYHPSTQPFFPRGLIVFDRLYPQVMVGVHFFIVAYNTDLVNQNGGDGVAWVSELVLAGKNVPNATPCPSLGSLARLIDPFSRRVRSRSPRIYVSRADVSYARPI